jgi:transcriptional regulator with GAF, ATPase, and Fis domain
MAFRTEDTFILQIVASSAGHCIHKLKITEEALLHQEKSEILLNVVKAIQDEGDVNQMIERLIAVAYDMMRCDRVTLYLCDTTRREIWCAVISQDTVGFRVPFGVGIAGSVAETGEMINVADAYADSRFIKDVDRRTGEI